MIRVLLPPYSSAVMLPRAWCLKRNFLVFINLLHTHTHKYKYIYTLPILIPSSAAAETFVTTQLHFLAAAQRGSKGKMGIQQPLSSPIQFHWQRTNFSSYLIYKIMNNLAMQQYHTQLSFPSIIAGT